jgi:hypothetical protein
MQHASGNEKYIHFMLVQKPERKGHTGYLCFIGEMLQEYTNVIFIQFISWNSGGLW